LPELRVGEPLLRVPGVPTITLNTGITYGGTEIGTGSTSPSGYSIAVNSKSTVGHIVTRTDPVTLPAVATPPTPTGTQSVTINNSTDSPGSFSTLLNLTLNSNVGQFAIPAGTYGNFTANGGSGFTLGVAGASTASVYNFQTLTLNSRSQLQVVGPVVITLATGFSVNGTIGASTNPSWLTLKIYAGNLTLNSGSNVYGVVYASNADSLVTIDTSQLVGGLACDKLTINSGGVLTVILAAANEPPTVSLTSPANNSVYPAPASILLEATAADSDGMVTKVEFFNGTTLLGQSTIAPYQYSWSDVAAGSYALTAKATDNSGASTTSASVNVVVTALPVITSATSVSGEVGVVFSYQITATNDPTSFSATGLPSGLSIDTTTGAISGTPASNGTSSVTIGATNAGGTGTATLNLTVNSATPVITSATSASGQVGVTFSYQITASNDPTSYSALGLPEGLAVDTLTGVISGTPATTGTSSVTIGATNVSGTGSATLTLSVNPPHPVITSLPTGTGQVGVAFSYQVTASNGPTSYSATGLPTGLSIDAATGLISGTPIQPGKSSVVISVTNDGGTVSTTIVLTILASLPYVTDFELSEGYTEGSLDAQLGWSVLQGGALITTSDHFSGNGSASISPASPASIVTQTFAPVADAGVVFVDFFAKPVADENTDLATSFTTESAKFALQRSGGQGVLYSFSGDGAGGASWAPTSFSVALGADSRPQSWIRLTARSDFIRQAWDLYADGHMVAADLKFFTASSGYFSTFKIQGNPTTASGLDDLYAGASNPLFADLNNNGIDDEWETAHGLSLSADNRNSSPAGNGVTVVQAYVNGTDPNDFFNGTAPTLTILGGDNQVSPAGQFNPLPFDIGVWNAAGTAPLVNAPVSFTVQSGGGKLALSKTGNPALATSLNLTTDIDGTARVYYQQPEIALRQSIIKVTAGLSQKSLTTTSSAIEILAAGGDSCLWQDTSGVTRLWGQNSLGQLSDGTTQSRSQMRQIVGLTEPIVAAALSTGHALAVTESQNVYAWGDNYFGQLGVESPAIIATATIVPGLTAVVEVAAGDSHSLALRSDGTVWSWGGNQSGQLGDGTRLNRSTPTQIAGLTNVVKIAAGARHSAALTASGVIWVWGSNEFGQLATLDAADALSPVAVAGLSPVSFLVSGRQHLLARCTDGTLWGWGDNHAGQLGIGNAIGQSLPQAISTSSPVVSLAAGSNHSAALCADGTLLVWGGNEVGQLGTGTTLPSTTPAVLTVSNVKAVACGRDHMAVMLADGTLQSWGLNSYGQLGRSTAEAFSTTTGAVLPPEIVP